MSPGLATAVAATTIKRNTNPTVATVVTRATTQAQTQRNPLAPRWQNDEKQQTDVLQMEKAEMKEVPNQCLLDYSAYLSFLLEHAEPAY